MKKIRIFWFTGLLAVFVITANAQQGGFSGASEPQGQGGFRGPNAEVKTVAEAKSLRDETPVILRGRIERFLGDEKYIFSDDSGSLTIEIERRVWGNVSVDENDLVEISGEIDRDWRRIEVEVNRIRKL